MEFISKLFETQVSFYNLLQIGVDVIMLGLLAVIVIVGKPRMSKKDESVMKSFERIVEETAEISKSFEINLEKRQELLQQITAKLDHRIQEARNLCERLGDEFSRAGTDRRPVRHSSGAGERPHNPDQQKVLALSRKGLNASEIAKSLKRPVGEVELILNLQKIAP
ncbi:MAG TPA: hypothetical protein VEF34_04930 [Syntrophobacteraceae bacterium]|nr:hypothetical protein [Syntrophobacteraceae bacterium]